METFEKNQENKEPTLASSLSILSACKTFQSKNIDIYRIPNILPFNYYNYVNKKTTDPSYFCISDSAKKIKG